MRFDGLDGAQHSEFNWRWNPTSEELFLASHTATAHEPATPLPEWTLQPGDVPGFRGAERDGVVSGAKLDLDWNAHAPQKIWRQRLGPGWSSLIVVDGHVVTQEQREESEVVACYDAATGKEIWVHADPVRFHEGLSGAGPRGTPDVRRRPHLRARRQGESQLPRRGDGKVAVDARSGGRGRCGRAAVGLCRVAAGGRRQGDRLRPGKGGTRIAGLRRGDRRAEMEAAGRRRHLQLAAIGRARRRAAGA